MVLLVLLLITVVGSLALRTALTSLSISTNSQAGQLLTQSSDTPLNFFLNKSDPGLMVSVGNVIGATLADTDKNEYVFCYKPLQTYGFGLTSKATVLSANADNTGKATIVSGSNRGFCDLTADFGSGRQAVVTQVAVTVPNEVASDVKPGAYLSRGTNLASSTSLPTNVLSQQRVRVTTTSMIPGQATQSLSTIQANCLSTSNVYISDDGDTSRWTGTSYKTLGDCLASEGMPVDVQVQEYYLRTFLTQTLAP